MPSLLFKDHSVLHHRQQLLGEMTDVICRMDALPEGSSDRKECERDYERLQKEFEKIPPLDAKMQADRDLALSAFMEASGALAPTLSPEAHHRAKVVDEKWKRPNAESRAQAANIIKLPLSGGTAARTVSEPLSHGKSLHPRILPSTRHFASAGAALRLEPYERPGEQLLQAAAELHARQWEPHELAPETIGSVVQLSASAKTPVESSALGPLGDFPAADLANRPLRERRWILPGLIPEGKVTLMYGDGGTGKSLLALQLGVCIAAAVPFLEVPVEAIPVLYLGAEDDEEEMHRRLVDICIALDVRLPDLQNLHIISLAGSPDASLATEEKSRLVLNGLYHRLRIRLSVFRGGVVILDTAADLYDANENDRGLVRTFLRSLNALCAEYSVTIILLAHPSQHGLRSTDGTSGSTAWNNSVRSRLYLTVEKDDPDLRVLENKKLNYGRRGSKLKLRWRNGAFVKEQDKDTSLVTTQLRQEAAEMKFMELLEVFERNGRRVTANNAAGSAPKVFSEHPGNGGFTREEFREAMERLMNGGKIRQITEGPPSRPTHRLVIVRDGQEEPSN